jgi:predicted ATPase
VIRQISLSGFKSIAKMTLDLKPINVLIGANGAGKSNLISFLDLLRSIEARGLQHFVARQGGANALLHWSAKRTRQIRFEVEWVNETGEYRYAAALGYAAADTLIFDAERCEFRESPDSSWSALDLGHGHKETRLADGGERAAFPWAEICNLLGGLRTYHFHDTSETAGVRQNQPRSDLVRLRKDASNLAPLLYRLQKTGEVYYRRILATIQQVAPWFSDFCLAPLEQNEKLVRLNWRGADPDVEFTPHQLPDGALRSMALIALLLQPKDHLPQVMVVDEPELGLHPFALNVVASLLKAASCSCQVIVATQSVALLDQFEPEDVVVVDREALSSTFERLDEQRLREWLEEYSLGELWQKNVLGGGPV